MYNVLQTVPGDRQKLTVDIVSDTLCSTKGHQVRQEAAPGAPHKAFYLKTKNPKLDLQNLKNFIT